MENEKDIANMFQVGDRIKLDPKKKQDIKMSILNSRLVFEKNNFFSMSFVFKYAYIPLALVLIFVGSFGIKIGKDSRDLKTAMEKVVMESDGNSPVSMNISTGQEGGRGSASGMGAGGEDVFRSAPKMQSATAPVPESFAPATAMVLPEPTPEIIFDYKTEGLLGGYDRLKPIVLKVIATNITSEKQTIISNKGCVSYYVVDSFDSREGRSCSDAYGEAVVAPGENFEWTIEIPIQNMNLSFGTHTLTFGIEKYFEKTAEFVVE